MWVPIAAVARAGTLVLLLVDAAARFYLRPKAQIGAIRQMTLQMTSRGSKMTRNYEIMHNHNRRRPGSGDLIRTATLAVPPGPMSFRKPQGNRNDSERFLVPPQPEIPTWVQQMS